MQQRLGAIRLRLALSAELATDPDLQGQLEGIGGTVEDAMEKLRYDLYYIKHLSVFFDLTIVLDTVKVILFGKGAK